MLFPVGHRIGPQHRPAETDEPAEQVRRGATFHPLTDQQFAVWALAHGSPDAIRTNTPWRRRSVVELAGVGGVTTAAEIVAELIEQGLLVEVTPGADDALEFARSHRVMPLMLGLGNSAAEPALFGIGFVRQPVLQVTHPIYDVWQWSTMDDTLWATCQSAADVARRAGSGEPDYTDPARLLTGFLGALHALLVANAACLDVDFRLRAPDEVV